MLSATEEVGWLHPSQGLRTRSPGSTEAGPWLPTPASLLPYTAYLAFHKHTGLSPLPCYCSFSSHAPQPCSRDSKLTSSMLSSLSCCVTINTARCGPASLQICPLPTPSRGSSLGWGYEKICPNNLANFCNFQRFGCYAHGLKGIAHLRWAPLGSGRALWSRAESASAQWATLLCGLGQVTQSL